MFPSPCLHWPWLQPGKVQPGTIWPQAVSWAQEFPFKPTTSLQHIPSCVLLGFLSPCCPPAVCYLEFLSLISGPWACLSHSTMQPELRAFRLERVILLMERPNLAHLRCVEFSSLVSQATEGRQKGTTCFGRWLAAPLSASWART